MDGPGVKENLIYKNQVAANAFGITLANSPGNILSANRSSQNLLYGIRLEAGAANNRIMGNRANDNGGNGIALTADTEANVVQRNRAFGNALFDIRNEGATNEFSRNKYGTSSGDVN